MSLFLRLGIGVVLLLGLCWGSASLSAWLHTRNAINELFDTQQLLFAKRLMVLNLNAPEKADLPRNKALLQRHRGDQDDDALAFAVFTRDGKPVLNDGENGRQLPFDAIAEGFHNGQLTDDDDAWRFVWLTTPDGQHRIVVGQEWEYREDMAAALTWSSIIPWLVALPLMLLMLIALVWHELRPLKRLTQQLAQRAADDETPLSADRLPKEIQPLVLALNALFGRIAAMMQRERRFTADAAHELRSPLAALQVQSEVIQLADDDDAMREHALIQLQSGIQRATRLIDQLLTLSRAEAEDARLAFQPVELYPLLQEALDKQKATAHEAGITLLLDDRARPELEGHALLLAVLIRNLLDNAIRYTPAGSEVHVTLDSRILRVEDNGTGLGEAEMQRLGERFWRPSGQEKSGSGLGLSIVRHVAQLHNMQLSFDQRQGGGLIVALRW